MSHPAPPGATPASHKAAAPASVACYVLTVSDSRTPETDTGGQAIRQLLETAGHKVVGHAIVKDDAAFIESELEEQIKAGKATVIILTGGTGVASRDSTVEAVASRLEKRLEGFGELFRMLSFQEIGSAAMMSRAIAGTVGRQAIFALPGSPDGVRLAMTKLILPELGHLAQQLNK